MTSGTKLRMMATVLAAAAAGALALPRAGMAQTPATAPMLTARNDLEQLDAVLNDPQAAFEQRAEAARRLVSRQTPQGREILRRALINLNRDGQLAAARALHDDPDPDPALIDPLFALLDGSNTRSHAEAAARALANYKGNTDVLTRLISKVQNRPPISESSRREVIKAIGSLVEKRTAEALVGVLRDPTETPAIHRAAAEALSDLTGIAENGQDTQAWTQWWQRNAGKSDIEFRNDLLPRRSGRFDQLNQRYNQLKRELQSILGEQYQRERDPAARADLLMRYLRSAEPEVREAGAAIIERDALEAKAIPPAALEQLSTMIGDSSGSVRAAVARALARIVDPNALEPLLTQLAQETDANVRAALAEALGPIYDVRAVRPLLRQLNDPSYIAARAAAEALRIMGQRILETDPALAQETADALRRALESRPAGPGLSELRESLVFAMVPLRNESLLPTLQRLIDERQGESPEMRRLAIRALGAIGKPQSAADIATVLTTDRNNANVRIAAVEALGQLSNAADYVETLLGLLDSNVEPDASVRTRAWDVLCLIFPDLPPAQLQTISERFKDQPSRQILIQQALQDQLIKAKREGDLASLRLNMGHNYMQLNDPRRAATMLRQALDYYKSREDTPAYVIIPLTERLIEALLASKQYPEAIAFASQSIQENANNQQPMGAAIRKEADRLSQRDDQLEDALALIRETQSMQPQLQTQYRDELEEIAARVRKRIEERNREGANGPQPINATTNVP